MIECASDCQMVINAIIVIFWGVVGISVVAMTAMLALLLWWRNR